MQTRLLRAVAMLLLAVMILAAAPPRTEAQTGSGQRYPVILIPGIAGTELYNGNELVWINVARLIGTHIPILNLLHMNWLMPLRLAGDGESPHHRSYNIRTGEIMRRGVTDAYSGMIGALQSQGYRESRDLFILPYDWRKDPGQAAVELSGLVDHALARTGAEQVILIGHSMGGLIARDYVVSGGAPKVKATISLATPWLGAPVTYRALAYGWDFGIRIPGTRWSVLAPSDVKLLVQNYPSVYAMAPSPGYFDFYPEGYISRGGANLTYRQSIEQGMAGHNRALALRAPAYAERLLDGKDHGVMQFIFAGTGRSTIGGVTERRDRFGMVQFSDRLVNGDEMVPLHSADLGFSRGDLAKAESYIGPVVSVAYVEAGHILFAQSRPVQDVVKAWIDVIHGRRPPGFETVDAEVLVPHR